MADVLGLLTIAAIVSTTLGWLLALRVSSRRDARSEWLRYRGARMVDWKWDDDAAIEYAYADRPPCLRDMPPAEFVTMLLRYRDIEAARLASLKAEMDAVRTAARVRIEARSEIDRSDRCYRHDHDA